MNVKAKRITLEHIKSGKIIIDGKEREHEGFVLMQDAGIKHIEARLTGYHYFPEKDVIIESMPGRIIIAQYSERVGRTDIAVYVNE